MKEKIVIFIIGLLSGAVITIGIFLMINNLNQCKKEKNPIKDRDFHEQFTPPERPDNDSREFDFMPNGPDRNDNWKKNKQKTS